MSWSSTNFALGSILTFLLGLFVLYRGETRELTRKTWFSLCLSASLWNAGKFLIEIAENETLAQMALYPLYVGAILIPSCYLHFVLSLVAEVKKYRSALIVAYIASVIELGLLFSGMLIDGVAYYPHGGFYEIPARPYWLYVASYVLAPGSAFVRLVLAFRRTDTGVKRNQFKYVIYSSLIGFLLGATSFSPFITDLVPPFGAPLAYFYTLPITYAVARYRLMDIDVIIRKSLVYASLLLMLLVPCFLVVIWGQATAFGTVSYPFSLSTLLLFIVVGFLFPKIRFRTEEALERVLFQRRVDYRDTLLRSSKEMVSIVDIEQLSNRLVKTVARALGSEKASLYLLDESKDTYNLKTRVGIDKELYEENILPRDDAVVRILQSRREGVVKEEIEIAREDAESLRAAERMGELDAEISVPIISKEKLIGILNLGHKEGKEIYSDEDIEVLSTLANQAAIAIENARLYENLKQSQATLRRADRLSSLGLLTAGLAHEIRNPLVAIRTFTQLLPERYNDAEFRDGFQGLALKEVDRICGLINDLLSFARPSRPKVIQENMNDAVDGIIRILESEAKEKNVEITRDFTAGLPTVWIDREQMKQVFMNLILNAIQAMKRGGSISIATRPHSKDQSGQAGQFVQVEIQDTGMGIPEENLDHIFDPFFTNKDEGSGLGLSISHQIVQEHGGYITVESKAGVGTSFFVNIPVGKTARPPVNGQASANEESLSHR
jgi:signal transduction histidine kinase